MYDSSGMQGVEVIVGAHRCVVPLPRVVEVAPRVTISPLSSQAGAVTGYLAYRGRPVPVVDLRLRLGQPGGPARLDEHLLVVRAARRVPPTAPPSGVASEPPDTSRTVALLVDRVIGITTVDLRRIVPAPEHAPAVAGLLALPDGLLLVADLDRVLSLEEERAVDEALARLSEGA